MKVNFTNEGLKFTKPDVRKSVLIEVFKNFMNRDFVEYLRTAFCVTGLYFI